MDSKPERMILGIQPTGWTNDDFQEIGDDTPYQVILDETRQAGFQGGSTGHNYPAHVPSLLAALGELKTASTWAGTAFTTGATREEVEAAFAGFQDHVTFLQEVGAQDVVVAELANAVNEDRTKAVLTDRPILNEAKRFLLTDLLNRAGQYAKERGMQLSYHPHVGTCVMTFTEAGWLMDHTDPDSVGLCLDTAHLRYGNAWRAEIDGGGQRELLESEAGQKQLEDFTRKYATRITHVHLKNVRREVLPKAVTGNYSFYEAIKSGIFTVPGDPEGELDLDPIMEILKGVGYQRWLVIEAEQLPLKHDPANPAQITPLGYAKIARSYLRNILGY